MSDVMKSQAAVVVAAAALVRAIREGKPIDKKIGKLIEAVDTMEQDVLALSGPNPF